MQKLYCYVDETGQDTAGEFFVVAVVIVHGQQESLRLQLEEIERATGKGRRKWMQARDASRLENARRALDLPVLRGNLYFAYSQGTIEYLTQTVQAAARAIADQAPARYKATVFVDGLPKSRVQWFGKQLRALGIRTDKVRGVRKEEADALMRLADAVCGFVRAGLARQDAAAELLARARAERHIKQL